MPVGIITHRSPAVQRPDSTVALTIVFISDRIKYDFIYKNKETQTLSRPLIDIRSGPSSSLHELIDVEASRKAEIHTRLR
jgi:hypothetical protein